MKELKIYLLDDGKITCFLREDFLGSFKEISVDDAKKILGESSFKVKSEE